jgi:phospholipid/cholesterol/gamma-HCH transport system substrate-binding protein
MRSDKVNYVVVGGFVLAMLVGLVVAVAVLTGRTGAADSYFAVYRNVTGVKFGTQVLYEGFPVGQVEEVTPMAKDGAMLFRVDLSVREGWRIPDDSIAQIAAPGLLSAITISIRAGKGKTPLKPGARIKSGEGANIFAVMSSVADDVRNLAESDIKPLLATLNTTVGAFGGLLEGDLQALVKELVVVSRDMARRVPKITDDIESVAAQMNAASAEINALMNPENRKKIEAFLLTLDESAGNFRQLSKDLGGTRQRADAVLTAVETLIGDNRLDIDKSVVDMRYVMESLARRIDSVNQNLEGTARNMYEFSRQIRQNPGLLLGGTPPEDAEGRR